MREERGKIREISNNKTGVTPALRVRHTTEDDLSSDEWHPYPQNLPLEIPFLALSGSVE
ncbi:MAG: hypothetical protein II226_07700 [Alistipes sp.]|nr:hypothetical protein [Alistipes sp.]